MYRGYQSIITNSQQAPDDGAKRSPARAGGRSHYGLSGLLDRFLKFGLIDKVGDSPTAIKASLKLAKSKQKKTIKTELNRTKAAAQTESFEALNEGIWLTEEHLQNIESVEPII